MRCHASHSWKLRGEGTGGSVLGVLYGIYYTPNYVLDRAFSLIYVIYIPSMYRFNINKHTKFCC